MELVTQGRAGRSITGYATSNIKWTAKKIHITSESAAAKWHSRSCLYKLIGKILKQVIKVICTRNGLAALHFPAGGQTEGCTDTALLAARGQAGGSLLWLTSSCEQRGSFFQVPMSPEGPCSSLWEHRQPTLNHPVPAGIQAHFWAISDV